MIYRLGIGYEIDCRGERQAFCELISCCCSLRVVAVLLNHHQSSHTLRQKDIHPEKRKVALRTAFIARFIVLREGRRSKAHRVIEGLCWSPDTSAQELYLMIREAFQKNGDKLGPVDRDLKRAIEHAERSVDHFIGQYVERATLSFRQALKDYLKSNQLLFGDDTEGSEIPRAGGWRLVN